MARAFQVLETVIDAGMPISVAELAERTQIPKPTMHRLVSNLVAEGLLRMGAPSNSLVPGLRFTSLLVRVQAGSWPDGPVRAVIRTLVDDIRETCNFGVIDRDAALYLDRVECDWPIRVRYGPGSRVPLHATAIGKVLWAHLPARARRRLLDTLPRPVMTANTITDSDALEEEFKEIRRRGYAINHSESTDGLIGLAVPVRLGGTDDGKVIAGVSVHAPESRLDIPGAINHLDRFFIAARDLGRLLDADGEA